MSAVLKDTVISDEQVAEYREKGFVVVDDIFSPAEVRKMNDVLDELVEGSRQFTEHTPVYDLEPGHSPDRPRVRRIKSPHKVHPLYWEMACQPRLAEVLQRLVSPAIRLHGAKINLKSAEYGSPVEWHQDWAFYPHTNDDVLAVGVMLDNMTPDNGPLLVIPGSHTGPTHDHHQDGRFVGAMDPEACGVDFSTAEPIYGKAGACSFHHVRAIHGSATNTSGAGRRLMLYQVAAGDAWDIRGLEESSWDAHQATMIAGEASFVPRFVQCPVRLPYPEPLKGGSIYESQTVARKKFFKM